jgi:hypothetical protein
MTLSPVAKSTKGVRTLVDADYRHKDKNLHFHARGCLYAAGRAADFRVVHTPLSISHLCFSVQNVRSGACMAE